MNGDFVFITGFCYLRERRESRFLLKVSFHERIFPLSVVRGV
jgi:hypothetical protein